MEKIVFGRLLEFLRKYLKSSKRI